MSYQAIYMPPTPTRNPKIDLCETLAYVYDYDYELGFLMAPLLCPRVDQGSPSCLVFWFYWTLSSATILLCNSSSLDLFNLPILPFGLLFDLSTRFYQLCLSCGLIGFGWVIRARGSNRKACVRVFVSIYPDSPSCILRVHRVHHFPLESPHQFHRIREDRANPRVAPGSGGE